MGHPIHWLGKVGAPGSECDNLEIGDEPKVAHVDGGHIEAKMKRRGSNQEVFEVDEDALGGLFAQIGRAHV